MSPNKSGCSKWVKHVNGDLNGDKGNIRVYVYSKCIYAHKGLNKGMINVTTSYQLLNADI